MCCVRTTTPRHQLQLARSHNTTCRCGSTLLHRVLLVAGVCSLSEPYWLEQLARARSAGAVGDEGEEGGVGRNGSSPHSAYD